MKTNYQTIQVEIRDNVAVFTMNNPPVNQLSTQFRADLAEAFGEAYDDDAVKAIVMTGTGKNFIAGADITEVQKIESKEELVAGMMEGKVIDRQFFEGQLQEYYKLRGWDAEGRPTPDTMRRLGIEGFL